MAAVLEGCSYTKVVPIPVSSSSSSGGGSSSGGASKIEMIAQMIAVALAGRRR